MKRKEPLKKVINNANLFGVQQNEDDRLYLMNPCYYVLLCHTRHIAPTVGENSWSGSQSDGTPAKRF
jgi:hypothetical protein